jgi:hypothetical protein
MESGEEEEIYINGFLAYENPMCDIIYPSYPFAPPNPSSCKSAFDQLNLLRKTPVIPQ